MKPEVGTQLLQSHKKKKKKTLMAEELPPTDEQRKRFLEIEATPGEDP